MHYTMRRKRKAQKAQRATVAKVSVAAGAVTPVNVLSGGMWWDGEHYQPYSPKDKIVIVDKKK